MLKVIGAGFGRTGTTSLKVALEALGFPCFQGSGLLAQPERVRLWDAVADGQPVAWDDLFSGYQAFVDWPGVAFWRELVDAYPDAKVVLSVRDPSRWYDSMDRSLLHLARQIRTPGFAKRLTPNLWRQLRMTEKVMVQRSFGGCLDREHVIEVFERHNQEVRRYVPAERLLVYEVVQGWDPLCEFLGVPVPVGMPFPRLNDTDSAQEALKRWAMAAAQRGMD
ncbi:MAG: sulfotransferase family protein [Egibacteraceae bacterium]